MNLRRPVAAMGLLAVAALAFTACGSATASPSSGPKESTAGQTATPTATTAAAAGGQLEIFYEENAQVELVAASGRRIYIDVWNEAALAKPPSAQDILLATHTHGDHYIPSFADKFAEDKKVINKSGDFTFGEVKVKSIAASHSSADINAADPDNHIFVIDFEGFHIVHFGSTAQKELTADQIAAIGKPDIAFPLLIDLNGGDDTSPTKIIEQVSPKLVVPTHTALASVQNAGAKFKALYTTNPSVTIKKDQLPTETTLLFMGQYGPTYGAILKAQKATW